MKNYSLLFEADSRESTHHLAAGLKAGLLSTKIDKF
jgi:hypothetical protein